MGIFKKSTLKLVRPESGAKPQQEVQPIPVRRIESLPWMRVAFEEMGVRELSGKGSHPRIVEYHSTTTLDKAYASLDETPWCSSFVNWVFKKCQMERTESAAASSWLAWGEPLAVPEYGCIVVTSREGGNHVNFFLWREVRSGVAGYVGLGGNQKNSVSLGWRPLSSVRGFRWPSDYPPNGPHVA